jgi:hypothetical protein
MNALYMLLPLLVLLVVLRTRSNRRDIREGTDNDFDSLAVVDSGYIPQER